MENIIFEYDANEKIDDINSCLPVLQYQWTTRHLYLGEGYSHVDIWSRLNHVGLNWCHKVLSSTQVVSGTRLATYAHFTGPAQ